MYLCFCCYTWSISASHVNKVRLSTFILTAHVYFCLLCISGYYYVVIHRLELRRELDLVIGAGVVTCIGLGWAVSKQIRNTSMLILPSMFTKEGRFWLTTIAYSLLLSG